MAPRFPLSYNHLPPHPLHPHLRQPTSTWAKTDSIHLHSYPDPPTSTTHTCPQNPHPHINLCPLPTPHQPPTLNLSCLPEHPSTLSAPQTVNITAQTPSFMHSLAGECWEKVSQAEVKVTLVPNYE